MGTLTSLSFTVRYCYSDDEKKTKLHLFQNLECEVFQKQHSRFGVILRGASIFL
ncbi:conserved hypothetical protein [Leptospira interrogans serovar Manilae]|uniref:Uncharacterized protein n=1 Tax=Leptospira interrogans serovar Manilae TaxID=214675 RepID=A0AAQ1NYS5_LEPIR|nr:conserved hypothetical protein [Leptospira interrogans serovar Manilae]